ncbi:MAG: nitroreductase family protein [Janthinobacterium lividum]
MAFDNPRVAEHDIDVQFIQRWSPRAYRAEEISTETVQTFLEAARWAPSSYNSQPWRFVFARRGTAHWDSLLGLLNEFNRSWAKNASVLIIVISKETFVGPDGKEAPAPSHTFDTGAAWAYLALQASLSGWAAHAMAGFDKEKALAVLGIPAGYTAQAAIAVGKAGDKSMLPASLQEREMPSPRQALESLAFEGVFQQ